MIKGLSLSAIALFLASNGVRESSCFTATTKSLSSQFKFRPDNGPLFVLSENESVSPSASTESTESESPSSEPWWKSVSLKDTELPLNVRSDFTILNNRVASNPDKELIYLDSAATSQKPKYVTDALTAYYEKTNSNVHRGAHALSRDATQKYEEARDTVASFINANNRREVVFTSGATEAINLVAMTYGKQLKAGDEVIISVMEHHSNIVPWQILKEELGIVLKFIPLTADQSKLDLNVFESLLTPNTKLVSVQHASNVMGCIHPLETIVQYTRTNASPSCKILVDACQSVPHQPVDVQKYDIDFLAASGHKLCGPTGIGFLWGKEDLLNSLPPFQGGGEMIQDVFLDYSTYAPAPGRFEAGTPPIAQAIGLGAAIKYLTNHIEGGMERIHQYELELGSYLYRRMKDLEGVTLLGPSISDEDSNERTAMVAFVCDDVHPSDLSTFLDMEGVAIRAGHHCCQPLHRELGLSHSARASLYFYNTKEEVDIFIEKLEETLDFFRATQNGVGGAAGEKDDDIFL